jgi:hypothetical protein
VDEWSGLRIAVVIVAWVTVAGGALMAILWFSFGGPRAVGPDDEVRARSGVPVETGNRRITAFSSAQVGIHGVLGIMTASFVTYTAAQSDDRSGGYLAAFVALAVTAVPGVLMFRKWRSGRRPDIDANTASTREARVEDRLPTPVVLLHGAAATSIVVLVLLLFVLD